jgi:hypothetical protein
MRNSAIQHLAILDDSAIVAAAFFEKTVQIWSWKSCDQIGEFETVLDFGGKRLAVTPDGSACIVGSYGRRGHLGGGIAAYSIPNGVILWHRTDIRCIQYVRLSGSGRQIYCGIEGEPAYVLETATGTTIERISGAVEIIGSGYTAHKLIIEKERYIIIGEDEPVEVAPNSFALLDASFTPDAVCIAEPKNALHPREQPGGVRVVNLVAGDPRWHVALRSNHVTFNSADGWFYCVAHSQIEQNERSLVRVAGSELDCAQIIMLGQCREEAFSPSGRLLVTAHGDVYETSTGNQVAFFDFPQRDYPNS